MTSSKGSLHEESGPRVFTSPCAVCGRKANHWHFGAPACTACQAFFKRSFSSRKVMKCSGAADCAVDPESERWFCKFCRFQKCLVVGMTSDLFGKPPRSSPTINRSPTSPSTSSQCEIAVSEDIDISLDADDVRQLHEALAELSVHDDILRSLRRSQWRAGLLLDQLTRPVIQTSAVNLEHEVPFCDDASRLSHDLSIEIEFMKNHDWFRRLSFTEKVILIDSTIVPLFLLSSAMEASARDCPELCYADGAPIRLSPEIGRPPPPLVTAMGNRGAALITRQIVLLHAEAFGLSPATRAMIEEIRDDFVHALHVHAAQTKRSDLVSSYLLLIVSLHSFSARFRANPPARAPLLFVTTAIPR